MAIFECLSLHRVIIVQPELTLYPRSLMIVFKNTTCIFAMLHSYLFALHPIMISNSMVLCFEIPISIFFILFYFSSAFFTYQLTQVQPISISVQVMHKSWDRKVLENNAQLVSRLQTSVGALEKQQTFLNLKPNDTGHFLYYQSNNTIMRAWQ